MKNFANLYIDLEQEARKPRRVEAIANYFGSVSERDGAIVCSMMMGVKLKSVLKKEELRSLACSCANINSWMFDECLSHGSNFLDTVSLIIPSSKNTDSISLNDVFLRMVVSPPSLFDLADFNSPTPDRPHAVAGSPA